MSGNKNGVLNSAFLSSILQFSSDGFVKEIEENASAKETHGLIPYGIYEAAVGWCTWGLWVLVLHKPPPEGARDVGVTGSTGVSQGTRGSHVSPPCTRVGSREAESTNPTCNAEWSLQARPNGRPGSASSLPPFQQRENKLLFEILAGDPGYIAEVAGAGSAYTKAQAVFERKRMHKPVREVIRTWLAKIVLCCSSFHCF